PMRRESQWLRTESQAHGRSCRDPCSVRSFPASDWFVMTACSIEEAMAEISFIVDQLNRAFDGEAWHGPALMEILEGIDGARAAARPVAKAHCIWELVVHLAGWEQVVCRRLQGQVATLNDAQNFGPIDSTTEQSWQSTVSNLRKTHAELIQ